MKKIYLILAAPLFLFACQGTPKDANEPQENTTEVKENILSSESKEESTVVDEKQPEVDNLKTIHAFGGEGKKVDWSKIKLEHEKEQEEENEEDRYGYFYGDCDQGVRLGKASSSLPTQGKNSYGINKINDGNPMTAWVEGADGYGIGESFEIKAPNVNNIYNGYQSSPSNWKNNSRVKKFKVYKDNKPLCYLVLTDEMGRQLFELPVKVDFEKGYDNPSTFRFEIVEVYKGDKWDDVAISEIGWSLCCFAEGTEITTLTSQLSIENLTKNQAVRAIDMDHNTSFQSEVIATSKQLHTTLLTVSTTTKTIQLTPEHPLYVKGIGFISLDRLRYMMKLDDFSKMIGTIELLTWDSEHKTKNYESITSITVEKGKFQTYTIRQLTNGTNFIANGFVTRVY